MSETYKTIIEEMNTAIEENNLDNFLAHCADDIEWIMVGDVSNKGKNAIRQWMKKTNSTPLKTKTNKIIVEGEYAASFGEITMNDKAGRAVAYGLCDIYRFQGDKIVEIKTFVIKTEAGRKAADDGE